MSATATATRTVPARRVRLRQIVLPTEHGSWGFLFEPIVAGLAVAFSATGLWIAVAVIGAFLARRPLQVLLTVWRRGDPNMIAPVAANFLTSFSILIGGGIVGAAISGGWQCLIPLAAVLPLALFQLWYEAARPGRQLFAELSGGIVMAATAASMALAAGKGWTVAAGLWFIFAARFLPSVLYVRNRLALDKGKPVSFAVPILGHVVALGAAAALAGSGIIPLLPVAMFMLLFLRAAIGLSPARRKVKAMRIGVWEVIYGALLVAVVIISYATAT